MEEANISFSIDIIDEREEQNPTSVQRAAVNLGWDIIPIKNGEVYLYDGEFKQIQGKPFKYCPWCGKSVLI
jgi:hypothetical protein